MKAFGMSGTFGALVNSLIPVGAGIAAALKSDKSKEIE